MITKYFTLKEANDLLPTIKAELVNLQKLSNELESQYTLYQILKTKGADKSGEPLFELEARLEFIQLEIKLFVENFSRKGVLLKMIEPGLLDFPSIVNGKEVLLCWREGEERVSHYHEYEDGFAGRRPHPES